jgi:hypothetical protein
VSDGELKIKEVDDRFCFWGEHSLLPKGD